MVCDVLPGLLITIYKLFKKPAQANFMFLERIFFSAIHSLCHVISKKYVSFLMQGARNFLILGKSSCFTGSWFHQLRKDLSWLLGK